MTDHIAAEMADYCAHVRVEQLPRDVVEKAKLCVVDFLSAGLTFEASGEARIALAVLGECARMGQGAAVLGSPGRVAVPTAAYLSSAAAAATARTDTHVQSSSHPGMVVVPALLSLAQQVDVSGGRLLSAVVVGYEVMCRLGAVLITPEVASRFRPTGVTGPVAAAAACAHLLGLDASATRDSLSIAANAAGGLNAWARSGTSEHVLHSAAAARAGVESALLARSGLTAASTVFDGNAGLLAAFNAQHRAHHLNDRLGRRFAMHEIVHKPAPACIYVQGPCQLAQLIVQRHRPDPRRIDSVVIGLTEQAVHYPGCDNKGPITDVLAGRLSVQFSVSSVLVAGGIFDRNWQDPGGTDANRLAVRSRLVADPDLTANVPARHGSYVEVHLDDGRVLVAKQDTFESMAAEEVTQRFHQVANPLYGRNGSRRILDHIDCLSRSPSVSGLISALQYPHSAHGSTPLAARR